MKVHLFCIDIQRDFCEPPGNGGGALFVPGADQDMDRLANFISRCASKLDDIDVTLDSHHPVHIQFGGETLMEIIQIHLQSSL